MNIGKPAFSTGIFLKKDRLHKNYEVIDKFGGRIYLYNGKTKEDMEEKLKENNLNRTQDIVGNVDRKFVEVKKKISHTISKLLFVPNPK